MRSLRLPAFIISLHLISSSALFAHGDSESPQPDSRVGVMERAYLDSSRRNWADTGPRPIRVTIWYPSGGGGVEESIEADGALARLWRDSAIEGVAQIPLILISHGSGSRAAQMFWLGGLLAERGYIAAAVEHNGNPDEELHYASPTLTDFFGWERARDVSVALDALLADTVLGPRIDRRRIGAAGFSLGGTTALWLAGARLDLEHLRLHSPPPPLPIAAAIQERIEFSTTNALGRQAVARASASYRDPRVRAVFALAPPMGAGFTPDGLKDVSVPVHIVVGDADLIAPAESNARHFSEHLPSARLTVLPGERGHYLAPLAEDQRRAEMREVAELALSFFDRELR